MVSTVRYYMTIFAYQDVPYLMPHTAHTFAVFVKETPGSLEIKHISWLPSNLKVEMHRGPGPGVNHHWKESIALGRNVMRWGPVEIQQELYERAEKRVEYLESGEVSYVALDNSPIRRTRKSAHENKGNAAINCIHAVTDLGGFRLTWIAVGYSASRLAFRHLSSFFINTSESHPHIVRALEIEHIKEEKF